MKKKIMNKNEQIYSMNRCFIRHGDDIINVASLARRAAEWRWKVHFKIDSD